MNTVAFMTTIFPMKEEYLYAFFHSLASQTFQKFDVIVVNDRYENFDKFIQEFDILSIIELSSSASPAKNREFGINYCLEQKYDILIFGDSDDYFESNRVKKSIELLENNDIVVNDLTLFNENGIYEDKYISNRIGNNSIIDLEFIEDKNIFGMTNTAFKTKDLEKIEFDSDLVAVDWCFFKKLLNNSYKAIFTNETISYYRQYENNTVGLHSKGGKYYLWWEEKNENTIYWNCQVFF